MIKALLLILSISFSLNAFALKAPEELWQASDEVHLFQLGASYEDFEIDSYTPQTDNRGEYSTKTEIYTFDYEYGLTKNYSLGLGTTYVDARTKYRDSAGAFERDKITGLTNIVLNFKGRHFFNDTHGVYFGIKAGISLDNKVRDQINTESFESNASAGRHTFTPYLAYVNTQVRGSLGLVIAQDITLTKTIEFENNGVADIERESSGDAGTFVTLFYERLLDDGNWAGLLVKYSHFSDFKWDDSDRHDPSARADNLLFQIYGNIDLGNNLSLIPKAYYVKFNDTTDATSLDDKIKIDSGGSFSFNVNIRQEF